MNDERDDRHERSRDACPECGAHRLGLLEFPEVQGAPFQPYSEIIGMGEPRVHREPGLGCLECGAQWRTVDSFRAGDPPLAPGEIEVHPE